MPGFAQVGFTQFIRPDGTVLFDIARGDPYIKLVKVQDAAANTILDLTGTKPSLQNCGNIGFSAFLMGTAANRPAAGTANRLYFTTDTWQLSYDNGTKWSDLNAVTWGGAPLSYAFASLGSSGFSTTSTSLVSSGNGTSLVCPSSGVILVHACCVANNSTQNDTIQVGLYRSTVGIPSAGSAPASGDVQVALTTRTRGTGSSNSEVSSIFTDTGLTSGTTYYYYRVAAIPTAGTCNLIGGSNQTTILLQAL